MKFRRVWTLLVLVTTAGGPVFAQLPPPDRILTEPRPALLRFGPFDAHARASATFIYDDNISLHDHPRTGTQVGAIFTGRAGEPLGDDFILSFSPGLNISKANALEESRTAFAVDYTPSFNFYLKHPHLNSIDHDVKMNAGYALTKLSVGLVQNFSSTEGGVVDVGSRVRQQNYHTGLNVRYEMTEKTFLQLDGGYRLTDYETLTDSQEWTVTPSANYQITPKVTLGLGLTVGQLFVSEQTVSTRVINGPSGPVTNQIVGSEIQAQTYVGPTLLASYKTTEKTDVSVSLGGEWRSYADGSESFGPVFALTGSYRPSDGTSFSLQAHRRQQNSAVINGANYITTGASLSARQRLRDRLFGTASVSYDHSDYESTRRTLKVNRQDDYFLLRCGLDAILGRSWSIGVFYQYREDVSTDESYSFSNNQVGIRAAWGY